MAEIPKYDQIWPSNVTNCNAESSNKIQNSFGLQLLKTVLTKNDHPCELSSLQHNIPRSFCLVLVFWNLLQTAFSFFNLLSLFSLFS